MLLDGEMSMTQKVRGHSVEVSRTDRPSTYGGAVQAYLGDKIEQRYQHTLRATRPSKLFVLPARKFAKVVRKWFPMATHLLEGVFFGMTNARRVVDQRERLTALGTITAGLTHELNNPAAAAARASAELGDRLLGAQKSLADLAAQGVDCTHLSALVSLRPALPAPPAGGGARWRSATPRTSWATGWRTTASPGPGTWRPSWWPPGSGPSRPRRSRGRRASTFRRRCAGSRR